MELRNLTLKDKESFFKAINEDWEAHFDFLHYWETLGEESFEKYVERLPLAAKGLGIPKEHVPVNFLFAFNEEGEIVGRVSIRHELDDFLINIGGNIGYGVVPSFRRQGYATKILAEALVFVRKNLPHLDKVLVTCDEDNIASEKTILRNGGVFESFYTKENTKRAKRFWISLI